MKSDSHIKDFVILLQETSGLLRRRFEQVARPAGLTLLQWRALRRLEETGAMRQVALVEAIEATPMTVSDMADRLQKAGLITRETDPEDSRAKVLRITEMGSEKLEAMRRTASEVFATVMEGLTDDDLAAMRQGLERMKNNLGAM